MARCSGIIVAMTEDGVIGLGGTLPWHYSADLKRFKRVTLNSTIIMGRKTWDSLPIQPLPERQNIVITRNKSLEVEHYSSLAQAIQVARYERIWFIGGASIYEQAVNHCDTMDITYVPDKIIDPNCVHFPDIDWSCWIAGPRVRYDDDERLFNQTFKLRHLVSHQ